MNKLLFGTLIAGVLLTTGCGKTGKTQRFSEEELASNPAANFVRGMEVLNKPDRKTGEVDYLSARTFFQTSEALGGGSKASFNAGWTSEKLGDTPTAENHYRKAYDAAPGYEKAMYSLTRLLAEQDKHDEVVSILGDASAGDKGNNDLRNDYMGALVAAGKYEAAVAEGQDILKRDPENAGVYRNLSTMYYAQNNYGMSQLTADRAKSINDGDPSIYNNMGVTYLIQGDEPTAIDNFKTAVKLDPNHFEANMNLGYIALNSGDYGLARASFETAVTTNPSSVDGTLGLAVALRGSKEFKKADATYAQVIKADPTLKAAYFNAATLHERYTKDFAKAMKYLEDYRTAQAGSLSPSDPVFARMAEVQIAQEAEDEKKRIEAEKKRVEEERRRRNEELLASVGGSVAATRERIAGYTDCLDPMLVEEINMFLEQAQMIVDAEEVDMAPDMQQMLNDYYLPMLEGSIAECASAPATADGGTDADAAMDEGEGEAETADTEEASENAEEAPEGDSASEDVAGE
jgi:tetratricopeptide (TPR) repeat protein